MADQSQTPEATLRPWRQDKWSKRVTDVVEPGQRPHSVADCRYINGDADAALIVEAVNAYDRLRRIEAAAREWDDAGDAYEAHQDRASDEYRQTGYRLDEEDEFAAETQRLFNALTSAEAALRAALEEKP